MKKKLLEPVIQQDQDIEELIYRNHSRENSKQHLGDSWKYSNKKNLSTTSDFYMYDFYYWYFNI